MKLFSFLALLCFTLLGCQDEENPKPLVKKKPGETVLAIQPYEGVPNNLVLKLADEIHQFYGFQVKILPAKKIPESAYTAIKSPRYRADSLIRILKREKGTKIDYILGITDKDISVTKKGSNGKVKEPASKYLDFGIFGLGYQPGKSCVVSTYRLREPASKFEDRFIKIILHEVGHNLGLPHCPDKNCLMVDAAESITTIDNAKKNLCVSCKTKIGLQ